MLSLWGHPRAGGIGESIKPRLRRGPSALRATPGCWWTQPGPSPAIVGRDGGEQRGQGVSVQGVRTSA
eukprot:15469146-Alexandrium_andersonii.AAC.1